MKAAKLAVICFMVGCIFSAQGHQHHHHSHGEGVLFVVHDQDKWQVKFILPAGNIFGFEHHTHHAHQDLEVEYSFSCDKPVSKVTVTLFTWTEAISVIEAQWIAEQAQGVAELTATKPYIEWPL